MQEESGDSALRRSRSARRGAVVPQLTAPFWAWTRNPLFRAAPLFVEPLGAHRSPLGEARFLCARAATGGGIGRTSQPPGRTSGQILPQA